MSPVQVEAAHLAGADVDVVRAGREAGVRLRRKAETVGQDFQHAIRKHLLARPWRALMMATSTPACACGRRFRFGVLRPASGLQRRAAPWSSFNAWIDLVGAGTAIRGWAGRMGAAVCRSGRDWEISGRLPMMASRCGRAATGKKCGDPRATYGAMPGCLPAGLSHKKKPQRRPTFRAASEPVAGRWATLGLWSRRRPLVAASWPSLNSISVGMPRMPNFAGISRFPRPRSSWRSAVCLW